MCSAWNHGLGCTCGFGGEGHRGGGGGGAGVVMRLPSPPPAGTRSTWRYHDDDFCSPTTCPYCGASVFFVRHNGGSVWFDDLGSPWPKHACFDDDIHATRLRTRLTEEARNRAKPLFGVVLETEVIEPGKSGRIVVKCSDGTIIDSEFDTTLDLTQFVGALVVIEHDEDGAVTLRPM